MHWFGQFWRYAVVGLGSNALLFGLYMVLTSAGLTPILAMSLMYALGVLQTFVLNRRWSFASRAAAPKAFARYVAAYAFGYLFNLVMLGLLHHYAGWSHEWVQGVTIVLTAILLFLLQRHWVFRDEGIAASSTT
ncbi:GtrA family protein [Pelomonas saccharophila]|nr:GtrA family protein [Roseateles saccharophilus]